MWTGRVNPSGIISQMVKSRFIDSYPPKWRARISVQSAERIRVQRPLLAALLLAICRLDLFATLAVVVEWESAYLTVHKTGSRQRQRTHYLCSDGIIRK
jgi:hypothetical protein